MFVNHADFFLMYPLTVRVYRSFKLPNCLIRLALKIPNLPKCVHWGAYRPGMYAWWLTPGMKALGEKRNKVEVISDSHGRAVRLSINGSITFFYWYRWNGKAVQLAIGDYPFASLSYSREQGLQCWLWLADGSDSGRQALFRQQKKTMLSPPKMPSFTASLKGL